MSNGWGVKLLLLGLLGALGVAGLALAGLRPSQALMWYQEGMAWIQGAGPWIFFGAMATLPAFGAPPMVFSLAAGSAFGVGPSLIGAAVALGLNLSLMYALGRFAFRPFLEAVVRRTSYEIPQVKEEDRWMVTLLVRITPGPPYLFQSYLLALAAIPFRIFFAVSWTVCMIYHFGFIVFGESLRRGNGKLALLGVSLIVATGLAVTMVRRKMARRSPPTEPTLQMES